MHLLADAVTDILPYLNSGGLLFALVFVVIKGGGDNPLWIYYRQHLVIVELLKNENASLREERDMWRDQARRNQGLARGAVTLVEKAAPKSRKRTRS